MGRYSLESRTESNGPLTIGESASMIASDRQVGIAQGEVVGAASAPRALIDQLIAAWNAHDLDAVMACYDPAYEGTDTGEATAQQGSVALRKMVRRWFRAFPDLRVEAETVIVEGEHAALGWRLSATHRGAFMRIPPTQRQFTMRGTSLMTIRSGRIARGSRIWDMAGFLRSVGLLPELRDNAED